MTEVQPDVFQNAAEASSNKLAALLYAAEGIGVIPVEMRPQKAKDKAGKKPAIYEWQKNYTTDPDQIAEWWDDEPGHGVGIIPGTANLAVVDIDGEEGLEDWRQLGFELEGDTPTIRTPGRGGSGYHLYYSISDQDLAQLPHTVKLGDRQKIDLITVKRFVSVPPTVRPSNNNTPYRVAYLPEAFKPIPPKVIQEALANQLVYHNFGVSAPNPDCPRCPSAAKAKAKDILNAPSGQGNNRYFLKLNEIMELPCLDDNQRKAAIQLAVDVVTGKAEDSWAKPISGRFAGQQLASAMRHQETKGGFGTGPCENAIRGSRVTDLHISEKDTKVKLVRGSDIVSRQRYFLWKELIPLGVLSFLVGAEGLGKSTLLRRIAAEVTTGTIEGDLNQPGSVLWISAEESIEGSIVPGLRVAGANLDNVFFEEYRQNELASFVADDGGRSLDRIVGSLPDEAPPFRLVVIDSVDLFLAETDPNRAAEVKQGLKGLVEKSGKHDLTVVAVQHINKRSGDGAANRIMGSKAQSAISRAVLGYGYHPRIRDQFILQLVKGSFASPLKTPAEVFQFATGTDQVVSHQGELVDQTFPYLQHIRTQSGLNYNNIFEEPEWLREEQE